MVSASPPLKPDRRAASDTAVEAECEVGLPASVSRPLDPWPGLHGKREICDPLIADLRGFKCHVD